MASSLPQEDWGNILFALGGGFTVENIGGRGSYMGEMLLFILGGWEIIRGLVVSIHLKENLPVVKINYLIMTFHFKDKLRHLL